MQEKFEKLVLTDEELDRLWEEATFVFDTNVLLDLYTHDQSTTEDLLSAIEELEERLFMPHQVLVEFARNRSSKIDEAKDPFTEAENFIEEWESGNAGLQKLKKQLGHLENAREDVLPLDDAIERLADEIEDIATDLREQIEESRKRHLVTRVREPVPEQDRVLEILFECFEGRVGAGYDQEQYEEIIEDAEWRRKREIPPGFEDIEEKSGYYRYGDQLIWHQVLDHAESDGVDIVFITADSDKGDWREGELRSEFTRRTGAQICLYKPSEFIEKASEYFDLEISEDTVGVVEAEEKQSGHDQPSISEIQFGSPKQVYLGNNRDAVAFDFPFTVTYKGPGYQYDEHSRHEIRVEISRTLLSCWNYDSHVDLVKALFAEVLRTVQAKVTDDNLGERETLKLHTGNTPTEAPYDPSKIPDPEGYTESFLGRGNRDRGNTGSF